MEEYNRRRDALVGKVGGLDQAHDGPCHRSGRLDRPTSSSCTTALSPESSSSRDLCLVFNFGGHSIFGIISLISDPSCKKTNCLKVLPQTARPELIIDKGPEIPFAVLIMIQLLPCLECLVHQAAWWILLWTVPKPIQPETGKGSSPESQQTQSNWRWIGQPQWPPQVTPSSPVA
jgi:hypothetical protein